MKHNLTLPLTFFFFVAVSVSFAQDLNINCTQTLRTARNTYDQGRLHEIPEILKKCLATGFSETERIEALKILVQTYIYLEEPGEADKAMLSLLESDHFFIPNKTVDPIEFQNLWSKFRYNPVWRAGVKVGLTTGSIAPTKNYYVWESSMGKGKYTSSVGFQATGVFEKDLGRKFVAAPEISFSSYKFDYTNNYPLAVEDAENGKGLVLTNSVQQSRLNLNLLFQYKPIVNDDPAQNLIAKFIPYISIGPSINNLMSSTSTLTANVTELQTGESVDSKDYYSKLNYSLIVAVGAKLRIGGLYLTGDIRYQYGLNNLADAKHRYYSYGDAIGYSDYGYVENDYRLSQISFNLGILYPRFSPKKLIK